MKTYLFGIFLFILNVPGLHSIKAKPAAYITEEPKQLAISVDESMAEMDPCSGHGSTVAYGVSWIIATCKSDCNRGLGFRCGRETYIRCGDGTTFIVDHHDGGCPTHIIAADRKISANIHFYDNNTVTLEFLSSLPEEERENTKFEMEDDVTINFPEYLLIGKKHYRFFTLKEGTYTINRRAGEFGSVTVNVVLNFE